MTKDIQLAPLTGLLDARSSPDLMPPGSVRLRQNLQTVAENKLRRGTGWAKLLSQSNYNNTDFHDQLLIFGGIRQPALLIAEHESTSGQRSLFIATQQRIARLSEHGGNWKLLGFDYGGTASTSAASPRFKSARVGDYVAFTNDFDPPMYHILNQVGADGESLYEFEDAAVIGLTRAKHVWSWRNFIIFADVEMDGKRYAYRLVSSDFDNPTSLDPARTDSVAFTKDLMSNERILGGMASGNSFLIYTDKNIWEMSIGADGAVQFRVAYDGEDQNGQTKDTNCLLKFTNILAKTPDGHLFGGVDGLYLFNQYAGKPERPEWLHRASNLIYDTIDRTHCEVHVAGVNGDEILISVAPTGATNELPSKTLRINWAYKACDVVDAGFTALGHYSSQNIQSVRDFIIENRICTLEGMVALGYGYENEGLPNPLPTGTAEFEPMSIYTLSLLQFGGTLTVSGAGTAAANGTYVYDYDLERYVKASSSYYIVTSLNGDTRYWKLYTNADVILYSNRYTVLGQWETGSDDSVPNNPTVAGSGVVTTEDYEMPASDADSLCALLGDELLDAGCRGCKGETLFVGAASDDWCLKQLGAVFYRETCANPTAVGDLDVQVIPANSAVDIVFVVDESALLPQSRLILAAIASTIEAQLNAAGVGSGATENRYGSVAFGHGDPAEQEIAFCDSAAFATAAAGIGQVGIGVLEEDAYEGIDFAINEMPWREQTGVKKLIFFITDEDRNQQYYTDGIDQTAQFASLKAQLVDGGFILAGMMPSDNALLRDVNNQVVIAADYSGKCYLANGSGGYTVSSGLVNVDPLNQWVNTSAYPLTGITDEYFALVMDADIRGYFYELNAFNGYLVGGATAASVLAVIVPSLTERLTNELTVLLYSSTTGSYILSPYASIYRTAPLYTKDSGVKATSLELDAIAVYQATPNQIGLRVGISGQPADPNDDRCRIVWHQRSLQNLKCISPQTEAQHLKRNTMPSDTIGWNFLHQGKFLYFELRIDGTAGDCTLSRITSDVQRYEIKRY